MSSFSISCSHSESLSSFSCPSLRDDESVHVVKIVCPACFDQERLSAQAVSLAPLSDEHFCMDCGRNPARYSSNLMMSMCDPCRSEQGNGFMQFQFRKISKNKGREIPNDIYDGRLFLGSQESAANQEVFTRLNVTHVLVCGNGLTRFYEDENAIRYHQLPIDDSLDQNLAIYLASGVQFIDDAIDNGGNVLVHCHAGVSRSASLVIAWIMKRMQCDYHSAYSYVKSRRPIIHPNTNFVSTLQRHWAPRHCVQSSTAPPFSTNSNFSFPASPMPLSGQSFNDGSSLVLSATPDGLSLEMGMATPPPSVVTDGLRTAMKSTSHSIRRFSSERMDPTGMNMTYDSEPQDRTRHRNMEESEDEEDDDFVLVLRSERK